MSQESLTEKKAVDALRSFFRDKPFLFFGTGMSCALDDRLGMPALKNELIEQMKTRPLTCIQRDEWASIEIALHRGSDLESALNAVADQDLLRTITDVTGAYIAFVDREQACRIAAGDVEWPATRFLKRLVSTLPESDPVLHALTPNYDMLFEYACDHASIPYANGFSGGIQRKTDWSAVERSLLLPQPTYRGGKMQTTYKQRKHVRLYKVHGSLSYFFHQGAVVENNAWMWHPPDYAQRVLITPGISKYEVLQRYRQELLSKADAAIGRENHFLFVGYGFNDTHLEEYIKRKLVTQGCRGLIITRDCNPRIVSLLADAPNLWLVCKSEDASDEGTRIFNRQYPGWLRISGSRLWDIGEFTTRILGG